MKNYIQPGKNVTVTSPANIDSGAIVVVGQIVGVAAGDAATGEPIDIVTEGVFSLPKEATAVISVGEAVFTDGDEVSEEDTAHTIRIGVAVAAAGNGATSCLVRLSGHF